jgi:ADP-dependent NAD(P)H-hydrate dehydratase / NAD(P)H-hydrate epimerase
VEDVRRQLACMLALCKVPELLTPREMAACDRMTIEGGTPGIVLMERAGAAVAEAAAGLARTRGLIKILCGPGGNGGDGFIAGRLLAARGFRVELFLLGDRGALRGDPSLAAERFGGEVRSAADFDAAGADLVVDALYGAGLSRDVDGLAAECIRNINAYAERGGGVLAVDTPSGIDGETGSARGGAVKATASVTFHRFKPGHLLLPGREHAGELILADIGLGAATIRALAFANGPAVWRDVYPFPHAASHKYTRGSALVLSGAAHRTGAARLAARAALRVGAGLVTLASPRDAVAVLAAHATAIMIEPFDDPAEYAALLADPRRNALLVGPGAGLGPDTRIIAEAALTSLSERPRAVVIDADAISAFAGDAEALATLIAARGHATVLTPHEGEFARLFAGSPKVTSAPSKLERARAAAAMLGAFVVYKGADTVVAAPDGRATIGWDLPPTLATAGSGDVLAGITCGLLAQGMAPFEAASAAVWLHGASARAFGPGLIAEDLPEMLPAALEGLMRPG